MKSMGVMKQRARIRRNAKRASILAVLAVLLSGCGGLSANRDESAPAASTAISAAAQDQNPAAANGAAASDSASQQAGGAPAEGKADGAQLPSADSLNGSAALVASPESRKIIYTANLTLQVEKYAEAQARIEEAVSRSGGYVLQFNENETSYEKSGSFVIKVPATGFNSLLSQLEAVSPSAKKSMQGQDVSEEYVDLTSRLKAKQVVESRLIAFMEKAQKTDELLSFSTELGKVQEEIERIKGRMRYLEQNVAYSTIEVRFAQKLGSAALINGQDRGPLFSRAADALNGSAAVLGLVFQWLVVILAAALPVVLVLAVIAVPFWLIRRSKRSKLAHIRQKLLVENGESALKESAQDDISPDR